MKQRIRRTLVLLTMLFHAAPGSAFEINQQRIVEVNSFNPGGHLWVRLSGNSDCTNPSPWFIIERWDNQAEPLQTYRKQMYQLVMMAFAAGKNVRVVGSACYLNQYLFAEQVLVFE